VHLFFYPKVSIPLLGFWPVRAMFTTIRTTITPIGQVFFGHYPETATAHVKILPFFKPVAKIIIGIKVVENAHN
jgi:hypothetical protein